MKKYIPWILTSIWLAVVSVGLGVLAVHENTPGQAGQAPARWPLRSNIARAPGLPTLVMFAHPHCACTRASIGELSVLMTHCQNKVQACVLFLRPKGRADDWLHTDLWRSAAAIPGVTVRTDEEGREATRFQAATSGQVVLYGVDGKLLFSGGITFSRGHSGDNAGRDAISQWIHHQGAARPTTPVFGCSLLNPTPECNAKDTVWTR